MMKISIIRWGLFVFLLAWFVDRAEADGVQMIQGNNFEGMIANPKMLADFRYVEGSIFSRGLWTPSPDLVRRAERQLPQALAQRAPPSQVIGTYYVPEFYTPKEAAHIPIPGHERFETDTADSIEDNFLYVVRPILPDYKRQYLGVTFKGKKYLFMSFIRSIISPMILRLRKPMGTIG
jgi:hypothetical protein